MYLHYVSIKKVLYVYSSILEGNTADPKSLPNMIDTLAKRNPSRIKDTLVVMDAGVATEENLELIKKKG